MCVLTQTFKLTTCGLEFMCCRRYLCASQNICSSSAQLKLLCVCIVHGLPISLSIIVIIHIIIIHGNVSLLYCPCYWHDLKSIAFVDVQIVANDINIFQFCHKSRIFHTKSICRKRYLPNGYILFHALQQTTTIFHSLFNVHSMHAASVYVLSHYILYRCVCF